MAKYCPNWSVYAQGVAYVSRTLWKILFGGTEVSPTPAGQVICGNCGASLKVAKYAYYLNYKL